MARARGRAAVLIGMVLASCCRASALDPSLEVSQYAHTAWTVRDGFSQGAVFAMAQTPDGYLWLGGEFGLFRFDGVHFEQWQFPAGQQLPAAPYSLLVTRDGTLWIGTFAGLVTLKDGKLTPKPEAGKQFVTSLIEDHEGVVWAGLLSNTTDQFGRLCEFRNGSSTCYGQDGAFGKFVWTLHEDSSGTLWAGAASGLWRWKPAPPKRYPMANMSIDDLTEAENGKVLIAIRGAGLKQFLGDKIEAYSIPGATNPKALLSDREVDSNKLLRDRDGGLWIGTHERGLIHVHNGRTDVFTKADGLSGNIIAGLFEDREGNIWVSTAEGLDKFSEFPVATISTRQGLSSDSVSSVAAATDGSVWIGSHDGLTRWDHGHTTIFRKANGLPDDQLQSLYEDDHRRIWAYTAHGLAYFENGRFVAAGSVPGKEVYSITGDKADNLWLSADGGLSRVERGHLVEHFPWSALGRRQQAKVLLFDSARSGIWLSFWNDGGVLFLKDGRVQASYTTGNGLGRGHVSGLQLDRDGSLWASTEGGLSRIRDGGATTLTTRNGLPCDTIHWSIEDDDRSLWLYTACGLVRITRSELDAWIADPNRIIQTRVWGAADGVLLRAWSPATFGPSVTKSTDGKLWFAMGEGVQVVDPHHLAFNPIPPPVHIEQVVADHKVYWKNLPGASAQDLRLPALTRDLIIDYTAVSLTAPEKVHFKYKLEGQDKEWREVVNNREVQYSNLAPGHYRFRVIASNNSGVWNDQGTFLDFTVSPAYWQTNWFRALCVAVLLALLLGLHRIRVEQLQREEKKFREAVETMPALAFIARQDGYRIFINHRWLEYTGLAADRAAGAGWQVAIHPDDLNRVLEKWRASLASGAPLEYESRLRGVDGQYRWFLTRAVPVRDGRGKIIKWCGAAVDIEDRKRAEQLQSDLAHVTRVTTLGELAASLAHEIKQPIAGAITSADSCLRWLEHSPPNLDRARAAATRIKADGNRAASIIDKLRSLYKKAPSQREPVAINEVIGEMVLLLRGEATKNAVSIRTKFAPDLPTVTADRVQLQQVLMNLMLNGIEAMKETGGVLTVTSEMGEQARVIVSVSDTGVGLPAENASQIFEAFFTTKPQGSGMGLAISRSIIESHGGRIWATANDGRGARFHFSLPVATEGMQVGVAQTQSGAAE